MRNSNLLMLLWAVLLVTLLPINKTFGQEAYAVFADGTLTLKYDDQRPTNAYSIRSSYNNGWSSIKTRITKVVFADSFKDYPVTSCAYWFYGCTNLTEIVGMKENLNTQNITSMYYMFSICSKLTSLDLSGFDTQNVTNMRSMFYGCSNLTSLDLSGFDTKNVTRMDSMFSWCNSIITLDLSGFDTKNVSSMDRMFDNCSKLTSLDLSEFDTHNVTSMSEMFYGCSGLTSLDLSGFNTQNVTSMSEMFYGCSGLTSLDLSGFDTKNVTNMSYMFYNCSKLTSLDLSGFDTKNVTSMSSMFNECSNLKTIYVGDNWTTDNVIYSYDMFDRCYKLYGGKGTTIYECQSKPWDSQATDKTYAQIDGGETAPGYLTKSGEEPFVSDAYAILDNGTLTFYYGQKKPDNALEIGEVAGEEYYSNWKSNVTKVVFNESFKNYKPKHTKNWFQSCDNLTEIKGMKENLNTSEVKNMSGMFWHCEKLTSIDLSEFDTKNVFSAVQLISYFNSINHRFTISCWGGGGGGSGRRCGGENGRASRCRIRGHRVRRRVSVSRAGTLRVVL